MAQLDLLRVSCVLQVCRLYYFWTRHTCRSLRFRLISTHMWLSLAAILINWELALASNIIGSLVCTGFVLEIYLNINCIILNSRVTWPLDLAIKYHHHVETLITIYQRPKYNCDEDVIYLNLTMLSNV